MTFIPAPPLLPLCRRHLIIVCSCFLLFRIFKDLRNPHQLSPLSLHHNSSVPSTSPAICPVTGMAIITSSFRPPPSLSLPSSSCPLLPGLLNVRNRLVRVRLRRLFSVRHLGRLGRIIGMSLDGCSADQFRIDVRRSGQTGAVLLILRRSLHGGPGNLVLRDPHATRLDCNVVKVSIIIGSEHV